jgi:hypothetical protein
MSRSRITVIAVLIAAGIGIYFLNEGCVENMNNDPSYRHLIGKEYQTKERMIFQFEAWDWTPYLVHGNTTYIEKKLKESDPRDPFKYLEKGSVYQITKIILHHRPFSGSRLWIKAKMIKTNIYKNRTVDVTHLKDYLKNGTQMNEEYSREIIDEPVETKGEPSK